MKYKAAIFDMDGTILDTLDDLTNTLNHALETNGFSGRTKKEARRFLGNGVRNLIDLALPEAADAEEKKAVLKDFRQYYSEHCRDNTAPYEGVVELLKKLKDCGIHAAVVSNKADDAVRELCDRYFSGLFEYAAGEKDGVRRKPWPDSVEEVMERFGTEKSETVYVGDSEVDAETGKNAGVDGILVDWGFRDRQELEKLEAAAIVSDTDQLYDLICG